MELGHQCNYHKGQVAIRHYVNQKKLRRWIVSGTTEDTDDHGPGVDWLVSPPHLTLTPLLHASCHGSAASDPPANTSQLSSDTPRESCGGGFPSGLNPTNRPARTGAAVLQESYFCASVAHPQDIPVFRWTIPTPQHSKICICNKCVKRWLQRTHCSTSTFYINNCVTYPCLCVCRPSSLEPS